MILCKFSVIFLIFILGGTFFVKPIHAQALSNDVVEGPLKENPKSTFMNEEHRRQIYDQKKLSPLAAIGYSFLLPGLGNMYAEQYFLGALLMSAMVFAGIFASYAFSSDQPEFYIGAGILAGGAYLIAPITASLAVDDFNENLRRGLKIAAQSNGKDMVGLSFKTTF